MVLGHEWLARRVASGFRRPPWVDWEDVLGWARVGLVRAARTFDPGRGFKFSTYAAHWARAMAGRFLKAERGRGVAVPADRPCPTRTGELVRVVGGEEWDGAAEVADHRRPEVDPALHAWCSEDDRRQRSCLDMRRRVVLYLRAVEGWTLGEVGEAVGTTPSRVQQLEAQAVRKLAAYRSRRALRRQLEGKVAS